MVRVAPLALLLAGAVPSDVARAPPAHAEEVTAEVAAAVAPAELGPVTYRVVALEALRLRVPDGRDGEDASVDLGAAGRWHAVGPDAPNGLGEAGDLGDADDPVDRGRAGEAGVDDALLVDLRGADAPPSARARPPPGGAGARAARTIPAWHLVATWEAAALVRGRRIQGDALRVARARRVVAVPLPPPDLARAQRETAAPWPVALRAPPPPHPEPGTAMSSRRRAHAPPPPPPPPPLPDDATALARAIARVRAGDPVGAAAALADATTPAAVPPEPRAPAVDAIWEATWRGEIALAIGDAGRAADLLATAAGLASNRSPAAASNDGPRLRPDPIATADVVAFLRERAAVAAWRAGAPRRAGSLAVARFARPRGPSGTSPPSTPSARDDRGDATLDWPPVGAGPRDADDGLDAARRSTAAWWRARRR